MLRPVGRFALWAVLAVLFIRGAAAILAGPGSGPAEDHGGDHQGPGRAAEALAIDFARTWLGTPSPGALRPFLAEGAHVGTGRAPGAGGEVVQAEVAAASGLGGGRWVLTVSCDLRDSRALDLVVPIIRRGADEVAALGAPSIVALPAAAGADPERPRPTAGPEAGAIDELVAKFIPAYLTAGSGQDLSYLLAPGSTVVPLAGALEAVSAGQVEQIGDGEGPRRELLVSERVHDPRTGATYPVSWRLQVARRSGRWYVAAVEGEVA
ncbi:MAG: conjugal transfer protein [Actinobacteria bacterium]|nr:conjugal transfer protein [Actinomycetota bacterium]